MDILTWLIVGLIAGVLASLVVGGTGYGLIGDIVVGIAGAFVGSWFLGLLNVGSPFAGLAGTIFVAFIGAILLLLLIRLIRSSLYAGRAYPATDYVDRPYTRRRWWRY
jgi:uncharacterized membrane protein YeaQ/YmgE (transglycosylase-associated protein family)